MYFCESSITALSTEFTNSVNVGEICITGGVTEHNLRACDVSHLCAIPKLTGTNTILVRMLSSASTCPHSSRYYHRLVMFYDDEEHARIQHHRESNEAPLLPALLFQVRMSL